MRQLTAKHLSSHELSIKEYKKKWGFPQRQSLSARSLSEARSKAAKERGLPEKLARFQEERKQKKLESATMEGTDTSSTVAEKMKVPARRGRKKKAE
jgi:hypothetical protein